MLGGTASLPAGDGSWAEVMVEWHPVIATAASAAASRGSWIRRGHFIGSGILAPAVGLNLNPSSPGRTLLPELDGAGSSRVPWAGDNSSRWFLPAMLARTLGLHSASLPRPTPPPPPRHPP